MKRNTIYTLLIIFLTVSCSQVKSKNDNLNNNIMAGFFSMTSAMSMDHWFFVTNSTGSDVYAYKHTSSGNKFYKSITMPSTSTGEIIGTNENHVYIGMKDSNKVGVLNLSTDQVELAKSLDTGVRPGHMYLSPDSKYIWVMNDGNASDPNKGADTIYCDSNHASVTVIKDGEMGVANDQIASVVKNICIGRGHHLTAFSTTSPYRAFVSNITDGTITVVDAEPTSSNFLNVISTLSLCDSSKETALGSSCPSTTDGTKNNSGPHGLSYSSVSGKVYNANTGYGTVTAINVNTLAMESISVGFVGSVNSSIDGEYILVLGADKNSDSNHLIGKINIIKSSTHQVKTVNAQDVNPDHAMFAPDGNSLFITSSVNGTGNQLNNLKANVLLRYDSSNLDNLTGLQEIQVGKSSGSHRSLDMITHENIPMDIFIPADGDLNVSVVDYTKNTVKETLTLPSGATPSSIYVQGSSHSH